MGTHWLKFVQIWHETWHTTPFGIYYCVEMVKIENDSHMFEIMCEVGFFSRFNAFLALTRLKSFKLGLFGIKHDTQY